MRPSPRKTTILLFATALLFFLFSQAMAETFCINGPAAMDQALETASANGEDDLIRVVQGTELGDIRLPNETGFLIKIEGGYAPGCIERLQIPLAPAATEKPSGAVEPLPEPLQSTTGPTPPPTVEPKQETLPGGGFSGGADTVVVGVPGYLWRHGCGPTAVGMVVGYWDGKGCSALFDGDAVTQTSSVNQGIASQGGTGVPRHYEDYSLPDDSNTNYPIQPDKSAPPAGDEHTSDSIADFMFTSWSSQNNRYGWSYSNHITPAFTNYVNLRSASYGPITQTYYMDYSPSLTWSLLTSEINAKRPMVFLVDSSGDGYTDHFVTVVGYRLDGSTQYYGCLDTWEPAATIRWERFRGMSSSYGWGVCLGYTFNLSCPSTPPPPIPTPDFPLELITPILIKHSKPPIWGAKNKACCTAGPYTFALNSGGVTKHSILQSCGSSPTWEGWVVVTEGKKTFYWSTYGSSCSTFSGQFSLTLGKDRAYYFWTKWTGSVMEIWVTVYAQGKADQSGGSPDYSEIIQKERVVVIPMPAPAAEDSPQLRDIQGK